MSSEPASPSGHGRAALRRWARIAAGAVLIWGLVGALFAAESYVSSLYRGRPADLASTFGYSMAFYGTWALLTPAVVALTERLGFESGRRAGVLAIHLAAGMAFALAHAGVFALLFWPIYGGINGLRTPGALWGGMVAAYFCSNLLVYAVIAGAWSALSLQARLRAREARAAAMEARLAQAELAALRTQLQPHFLFNTLHGVSALVREDPAAAERMIARLADLLRMTLESGEAQESTLEREALFLDAYLEIERARYGPRLDVSVNIASDAADALAPSLLLQPLVENAIRHGVAPRVSGGRLSVTGERHGARLRLVVADDGPGTDPGQLRERVGLGNTRARLAQLFGAEQELSIRTAPGAGFEVTVILPYRTSGAGGAAA